MKRLNRRTVVSVLSILAVAGAGAFAMAANFGILDSSSRSRLGTLSAAGDLLGPDAAAVAPAATGTTADGATAYVVDEAGLVRVRRGSSALVVDDVVSNPGWRWSLAQTTPGAVTLEFQGAGATGAPRTLAFRARLTTAGSIVAAVEDLSPAAPVPAPAAPLTPVAAADSGGTGSTGGAGGNHDDDEDGDEEHEEHEGRDDDD